MPRYWESSILCKYWAHIYYTEVEHSWDTLVFVPWLCACNIDEKLPIINFTLTWDLEICVTCKILRCDAYTANVWYSGHVIHYIHTDSWFSITDLEIVFILWIIELAITTILSRESLVCIYYNRFVRPSIQTLTAKALENCQLVMGQGEIKGAADGKQVF